MNATVKTFRGRDPKSALDAVKASLGDEAIILNTREVGGTVGPARNRNHRRAVGRRTGGEEAAILGYRESEVAALRRIVEELRAEVRGGRAEPKSVRRRSEPVTLEAASRLERRLIERGVEPALAGEIAREALRSAGG